ncbi:MAG: glycoside hydrolase family 2, partial [Verrucomicrobiota bacterium]|nr:glycoside hydrolase family 2 [Verrucomicrobiota bacterium]
MWRWKLWACATAAFFVVMDRSWADWAPKRGPLTTTWGEQLAPDQVHPEYPRPQMVRSEWKNLNGLWEYAITDAKIEHPADFTGEILVPFPVESALSGVMQPVLPNQRLWYRRSFDVPQAWSGRRILLHFGAVDWEAQVWVNGHSAGIHQGGFDAFSFDVTDYLRSTGPNELVVAVLDPTDTGTQARGKQVLRPGGIMYTAVTGIWQTVWLEPVSPLSIESMRIVPDVDRSSVSVSVQTHPAGATGTVDVVVKEADGEIVGRAIGQVGTPVQVALPEARLWSPDTPYLYRVDVDLRAEGSVQDRVESYFGMRKVALGKDAQGLTRILLNDEFLFQVGPLDQGWWPDGLYTAPSDDALRYDLEVTKQLGFNMLRKHVKVEPARLYYWADRLGLLVWQDMPSGDRGIGPQDPDIQRTAQSAHQYYRELQAMIDGLYNHPSIIM